MTILLIVIASLATVLVSATRTEVDANKRFQAQEQARTGLTQPVIVPFAPAGADRASLVRTLRAFP